MKEFIKVLIITIVIMALAIGATYYLYTNINSEMYPNTAMVYETDEQSNMVFCKDYNGYIWTFKGIEDWEVGDIVSMIMYTNRTEHITDDEIVKMKYSGHIDMTGGD